MFATSNNARFVTMDYEAFVDTYQPIHNPHFFDAPFGGTLFETIGEEFQQVLRAMNHNPANVWTLMEGEDGLFIGDGFHLVNRLGYFITENPCPRNISVEVEVTTD